MAKFLIQDIMPPEKRRQRISETTPSTPTDSRPIARPQTASTRHEVEEHIIHSQPEEVAPRHEEPSIPDQTPPHEEHIPEREPWTVPSGPSRWGWSNSDFGFVSRGSGLGAILKAVMVCIIILGGYVAYATLTSKAEVIVTPRAKTLTLPADASFTALKEPGAGELGYSVMRFSLSERLEVPATGSKEVSEKASGRIIIYNEFSAAPQRLIKNTRFESPSGKIYRINESITVPGVKKDGAKTNPGSIEVTVYADEPGPAYNSEPTDFTIPGFKSDAARYKAFYARSIGSISGGVSGTVKTISDEDLRKAADELRVTLDTKLRTKARGNLGKDQLMFDAGITTSFAPASLVPTETGAGDVATIERTATLAAVVFDQRALAREIARTGLGANYQGEQVSLINATDLSFAMQTLDPEGLFESTELDFGLAGNAKLVWDVDAAAVAGLLRGAEERATRDILAKVDGSIDTAFPELRPFWRSTYPEDPLEIIVTIKQPN